MIDVSVIDFSTVFWVAGIAVWIAAGVYAFVLALRVEDKRVMRCPDTGALTLIDIEFGSRRAVDAPGAWIVRCGLWPKKENCGRGCLARCPETWPGQRGSIDALRPFERR